MSTTASDLAKRDGVEGYRDFRTPWMQSQRPPRQVGGPFAQYDHLDRKQPSRLHLGHLLLLIAETSPGRVREVPRLAVVEDGYDDEGLFAMVKCPCGANPIVRSELRKCVCERYYTVLDGRRAFVVYGEMEPPS